MEPNQVKQQAVLACGEVHLQLQSHPLRQAGTGNPNVSKPHASKESQSQPHGGVNRLRRHRREGLYSRHIRLDDPFDFFLCLMLNTTLMSSTKEVKFLSKEEQDVSDLKAVAVFLLYAFFLNASKFKQTNGF